MIVVCPSCQARFQYDENRFQGAPSKRFKCPRCATTFEVPNPLGAGAAAPPAADPAPVAPAVNATPQRVPEPPAPLPPPPPPPAEAPVMQPQAFQPGPPPSTSVRETTARRDRDAMLAAAGLKEGSLPPGWRVSLAFLTGPQASMVKQLDKAVTVIGREEGDVITQDPETSRRHASIEVHPDGSVWLTDLGSTNGTFVDSVQIFGTLQLLDRQEFTCGKSTFMILVRKEDALSMD